jgi:exonuclease SbcD
VKIIHCSDLHLGVTTHSGNRLDPQTGLNVRVADVAARWLDCCASAVAEQVDAFLFTGDAFHYRNPDASTLRIFAQGVKIVADAGIPVVLLTGNHDVSATAGRAHALSVFQALAVPNVFIIDRPTVLWLNTPHGRLAVAGLPWPSKNWTVDYARGTSLAERDALLGAYLSVEIKQLADQIRLAPAGHADVTPILMAHIGVSEAQAGGEAGMMLGREVQLPLAVFRAHLDVFDYVALGHYHRAQGWPAEKGLDGPTRIAYAGSLERVDFGEVSEPKGWNLLEWRNGELPVVSQVEGRATAARRMVDIDVDCRAAANPTAEALVGILVHGDLSGCIVRLTVHLRSDQTLQDGEVMRALAGAWHVAPLVKEVERTARLRLGEDVAEVAALTPEQAFARYLERLPDLTDERRKALTEVGARLMRAVDQEQGG